MRAARYRFPDDVRSATRSMASQMVGEGVTVETPEQLDAWIGRNPAFRDRLTSGGYDRAFTASDLLPLLQVFIVQAGGAAPAAEATAPAAKSRWLIGAVIAIIVLVLMIVFATDVFPAPPYAISLPSGAAIAGFSR